MQAKALRSAVDSGLEVPPEVIDLAIKSVREHYSPQERRPQQRGRAAKVSPASSLTARAAAGTMAMAAAGVVCLQEFGQYDDWRIPKNMDVISAAIKEHEDADRATTARSVRRLHAVLRRPGLCTRWADEYWNENYPKLRDQLDRRPNASQP